MHVASHNRCCIVLIEAAGTAHTVGGRTTGGEYTQESSKNLCTTLKDLLLYFMIPSPLTTVFPFVIMNVWGNYLRLYKYCIPQQLLHSMALAANSGSHQVQITINSKTVIF